MSRPGRAALAAALVIAAALALVSPLLGSSGLPAGSDVVFAYHSAHGFRQALSEGVLYPRWIDNSNHGFGGATFIYYAPLPYYVVGLVGLAVEDLGLAFRISLALAALLSGWTCFLCLRPLTGRVWAALGAAAYVLAPYHALDLYDRFAYAEYWAFVWFPLIALGLRRVLAEGRTRAWLPLAAALSGLLFTHLVTAFMGVLVLGPYAAYLTLRSRKPERWLPVSGACAVALAAAAAFWLPMISQRQDVHMEWVVDAPYGDWRRNFVYRDEVAHGYRPAPIKPWVNGIATTQGVAGLAAVLVLVLAWRRGRPDGPRAEAAAIRRWEAEAQALLVAWTFFLQIPAASFLWRVIPELGTVQFPWRFGLFQALAGAQILALAGAAAVGGTAGRDRLAWRRGLLVAGLLLAWLPALTVTGRLLRHPTRPLNFDRELASRPYYLHRVMTEYLPRDMAGWQEFADQPYRQLPPAAPDGPGQVQVETWESHRRVLQVTAPEPTRVLLRTFRHPGWRAWLDDRPVPILSDDPMARIAVAVPAGEHRLVVAFGSTPDRRLGTALSLMGLATMGFFAALRWGRRRREPGPQAA